MKVIRIWFTGIRDGLSGCASGLTFDNNPESKLSHVYDRGRNFGEWMARSCQGVQP